MITKSYIEFLIKNRLTADQLIVMWCLMQEERDLLKRYVKPIETARIKKDVDNLVSRGYMMNESKIGEYHIANMYAELEYKELILADVEECARDLRNAWSYTSMEVNGNNYPAKNIGITDLTLMYSKIIKGNIMEHFRILAITKRYVEDNPKCVMGLKKYVDLEYWGEIDVDLVSGDFVTDI